MHTTIYLIRHAQAAGNHERRFQGRTDTALTEKGRLQAAALAKRFAGTALTAVYTSPLVRAAETAETLAAPHGLRPIVREGLIEIDGGDFENRLFSELELEYTELFGQFLNEPHIFPGAGAGESMRTVRERMELEIMRVARENAGGTVAAVSHGAAIRACLSFLMGLPFERLSDVAWGFNTSVAKIVFEADFSPCVEYCGDISHLPDELRAVTYVPAKA